VDTAPIVYVLEDHPQFARRFRPLFEAHESGALQLAITTVTIAEVMTGLEKVLFSTGEGKDHELWNTYHDLSWRYREIFLSWRVVPLDYDVACRAAELRAAFGLKLPDAVQAASALILNADALVTHDRDFARLKSRLTLMRLMS
jgi:predicted nucleic acid-binding protein